MYHFSGYLYRKICQKFGTCLIFRERTCDIVQKGFEVVYNIFKKLVLRKEKENNKNLLERILSTLKQLINNGH